MRVALLLSYDGAAFRGNAYQRSPGTRTVEGELARALLASRVAECDGVAAGEALDAVSEGAREGGAFSPLPASLERAGRTDAGVSASGMVYSVDATECSRWALPGAVLGDLPLILNRRLGNGLTVLGACEVGRDFSARKSAAARRYRYLLWVRGEGELVRHTPGSGKVREDGLSLPRMRECASLFVGRHDFSRFAKLGTNKLRGAETRKERFLEDPVREVFDCSVEEDSDGSAAFLRVTGSSFLYHQVRYMSSAVLRVGRGEMTTDDVVRLLEGRLERSQAGLSLGPASRLVFEAALYPTVFGAKTEKLGELPFILSPASRQDLSSRLWVSSQISRAWRGCIEEGGGSQGDTSLDGDGVNSKDGNCASGQCSGLDIQSKGRSRRQKR